MALVKCKECGKEISKEAAACPQCGAKRKAGFGKKMLIGLGVLFVLIFLAQLGEQGQKDAVKTASAAEIIDASARGLVYEYEQNEVASDSKYKGKILRVRGAVGDIKKDILDELYVTLEAGDPIRSVQCYFDKEHSGALAKLSKGASISIRGRCDGLMMNVILKDCVLE